MKKRGDSWYDETVLERETLTQDSHGAKELEEIAEILRKVVDLGTRVLGWTLDHPRRTALASPVGLLRNVLEKADSISCMIPNGQVDSINVVLRSLMESWLQIAYMVEKDNDTVIIQRDRQYRYFHRITELKGLRARAAIAQSLNLPVDLQELQRAIKETEDSLTTGYMQTMHAEFLRMKAESKRTPARRALGLPQVPRPKNWYTLFDGPQTLADLAKHLNRAEDYEIFYRTYSQTVHGADSISSFSTSSTGETLFKRLRQPGGIQSLATICMHMTRASMIDIAIAFLSPARMEEYRGANIKLKPLIDKLSRTTIVNFVSNHP